MRARPRLLRLCLVAALSVVGILFLTLTGGAQTPAEGVEVRLAARANADGSFSVGLQYFADGRWRGMTPTRSVVPADSPSGTWRHSSVLRVPTPQTQVEISTQYEPWRWTEGPGEFIITIDELRYRTSCRALSIQLRESDIELNVPNGDCEADRLIPIANADTAALDGRLPVRLAARFGEDDRLELGLQRRAASRWEALVQPRERLMPARPTVGRWYVTSPLRLAGPPPRITGDLRTGASLAPVGAELRLTVDGAAYTSVCGWLQLSSLTDTIMVDTRSNDCAEARPLVTICSAGTPLSECDVQQNLAYEWERNQPGVGVADDVALTRRAAQTIVNAIWRDYTRSGRAPTVVFSTSQAHGHYSGGDRQIVLGTGVQTLGSLVHELSHALVDHSGRRDPGHGGVFAAMLLQVWESHLPIVDPVLARIDAKAYGLEVAAAAPLRPLSDAGAAIVEETLCEPQPKSEALCRAFDGELDELSDAAASGLYVGWGGTDQLWWSVDDNEHPPHSYVARDTSIDDSFHTARLSINCEDGRLELGIYWEVEHDLDWTVRWWISGGGDVEQTEEWMSGWGTWGDQEYEWTGRADAAGLLAQLFWAAQSDGTFTAEVRERGNANQRYTATWPLDGLFETPVQPNLTRCGR